MRAQPAPPPALARAEAAEAGFRARRFSLLEDRELLRHAKRHILAAEPLSWTRLAWRLDRSKSSVSNRYRRLRAELGEQACLDAVDLPERAAPLVPMPLAEWLAAMDRLRAAPVVRASSLVPVEQGVLAAPALPAPAT